MHIQGEILQVAVVYRAPIVSMQLLLQHTTTLLHHVAIENGFLMGIDCTCIIMIVEAYH